MVHDYKMESRFVPGSETKLLSVVESVDLIQEKLEIN